MPPSARLSPRKFFAVKAFFFVLSLSPVAAIVGELFFDAPAEPGEFIVHESGEQAIRFLIITLAMTPLNLVFGWSAPVKLRRMFGLFAFFYAACHFSAYLLLDLQLDFGVLWNDIVDRKYITVGFAALLLLIPLAATSNGAAIKKIGFAAWQKLHRAMYPICILGAVHFLWIKKGNDIGEPLVHLAIILSLLALRFAPVRAILLRRRKH